MLEVTQTQTGVCRCEQIENGLPDNKSATQPVLPGDMSEREPPDPIPNSEVKTFSADDSVGFPHVKVGQRQAFIQKRTRPLRRVFF